MKGPSVTMIFRIPEVRVLLSSFSHTKKLVRLCRLVALATLCLTTFSGLIGGTKDAAAQPATGLTSKRDAWRAENRKLQPIPPEAKGVRYFSYMEDIPVMPGLMELPEEGAVYDKPEGRIVSLVAISRSLPPGAAQNYYAEILPALGWVQRGPSLYKRGNDELELKITEYGNMTMVEILVRPAG